MERKIVSILQPFILKQDIYVYENGNKIDAQKVETSEFSKIILTMAKSFNVKNIELGGPRQYVSGLKNQIMELKNTQYQDLDIEIKIL